MTVRFPVDISLFENTAHTPSQFTLERSMGPNARQLRDYCIPVNSYFPSAAMMKQLTEQFQRAIRFYPATNQQIARQVAACFGLDPDCVVMFNGATELLSWLDTALVTDPVLIPIPTFGRWTDVPKASGRKLVLCQREQHVDFRLSVEQIVSTVRHSNARTLVLCNPNNPTGACLGRPEMLRLLDELHDLPLIVIDESFLDFSDLPQPSVASEACTRQNLVVMKSLGKNLGLHGVRLGYSVSHPDTAARLRNLVPCWNINAVAEMVIHVLGDHLAEYEVSRQQVIQDRRFLSRQLKTVDGVTVFPSQANFVYCRLPQHVSGDEVRTRLLTEHGYLIRHCGNKLGADSSFLRVVARPAEESSDLVAALKRILHRDLAISA